MATYPQYDDPFSSSEKVPSLSWRDLPVGSAFTLKVLAPAKALQSTNYESGDPDYWDTDKTRPKMAAVINVRVLKGPHSVGEDRSIWAQIPSNLFIAIRDAQKAADARITEGGILHLSFTGTKPHDNPRFSPIKQYEARYTPPTGGPDPFTQPHEPVEAPRRPQEARRREEGSAGAAAGRSGWRR